MRIFGFEVTAREAVVSIAIILVLCAIGFSMHSCIDESISRNAEIYNRAFKPTSEEQFVHGAKTSIGNTLMRGVLIADQPAQTKYVSGDFMALSIVKEHHTMHTGTYTTTDSNGNTTTHTYYYWTWDEVRGTRQHMASETFSFCGVHGNVGDLNYKYQLIDIVYEGRFKDDRWVIRGLPQEFEATIFADLRENYIYPIGTSIEVYDLTVTEVVATKNSHVGSTAFVVFWLILVAAIVLFFVYQDNDWLESDS